MPMSVRTCSVCTYVRTYARTHVLTYRRAGINNSPFDFKIQLDQNLQDLASHFRGAPEIHNTCLRSLTKNSKFPGYSFEVWPYRKVRKDISEKYGKIQKDTCTENYGRSFALAHWPNMWSSSEYVYGNYLGDVFLVFVAFGFPPPRHLKMLQTSVCASVRFRMPCPHSVFAPVFDQMLVPKGLYEKGLKPNGYKDPPQKE